ncbi:hypothetical protein GALL_513240 [mine drainage metagenome]|uniref:Uncharacterized protein n=1 Tax=mine drainage metagenome TaxID=410659 RepID=A0A1J5PHT8_9ZZZZ
MRHLVEDGADVVVGHGVEEVCTIHRERIERALLVDRGRQEVRDAPAFGWPRADHVVVHRDQLAVAVKTGLDLLERQRTREVHGHVVFARVDDLDRLADGLGRLHRRHHHVAFETPAEAAAQPHLVQHDIFGVDPGGARRDRAGARRELVAGIDMPDLALLLGRGGHRLHWRMDVDAGGVFRFQHLRRRPEGRRRIAILDEEQAGVVKPLQPLGFGEQGFARQLGVGSAVIGDLERVSRLAGAGIGIGHRHHPAGRRCGLVIEDDRLDEAMDLLCLAVVDRLDRRAVPDGRRDNLAIDHARQHDVDSEFGGPVGLGRDVELRNRNADHGVLLGGLQLDRLEFVRREGLGGLAALDDVRERHRFLRFRMRNRGLSDDQLAGRHAAHRNRGGFGQCDTPGGTRTAHRIEVHHRAPAAAGHLRAEHGVVELRIV